VTHLKLLAGLMKMGHHRGTEGTERDILFHLVGDTAK
jgi:hypothetical protein